MTEKEILKLIKWDNKTKTLTIKSDNRSEILDISINVRNDIKGDVDMCGIGGDNSQGDIGGYNSQYNIYGYNSQYNIDGNNWQGGIGGDNSQGDIGGSNRQLDIDGNNRQRNINGYYSYNSKHYNRNGIKTFDVDITDGVVLHSITKKTRGNLSFIGGIDLCGEKMYLVKTPTISYHSNISMEEAKKGWKNKRKKLIDGVKDFVKECKKTNKISIKGFMEATGSCKPGTIVWLKKANMEYKEDLSDVYDFDYAIEKFREFPANELMGILEVVNES